MLKQLEGHVTAGCQMAEETLTPASVCSHMLPLMVREHLAVLPEQAAVWQSIVQVASGTQLQECDRNVAGTFVVFQGVNALPMED